MMQEAFDAYLEKHFYVSADDREAICHRMVLVCGTSTCHMAVSFDKVFIPGVWGPYWSGI